MSRAVSYEHEDTEWRRAVAPMTEWERAPYDDHQTYADVHRGNE